MPCNQGLTLCAEDYSLYIQWFHNFWKNLRIRSPREFFSMYNNKPPFSKHPPLSTFQSTHVDSNLHTLFQSSYSLCNFYFLISQDRSLFKPFNCNLLVFLRSCSHWNLIWINKTIKSNTTLIQMSNQPKTK